MIILWGGVEYVYVYVFVDRLGKIGYWSFYIVVLLYRVFIVF